MREIIQSAWEVYGQFNGAGMHMALFLAALLFLGGLSRSNGERSNARLLSWYSVLFFGIFFCPVTAKVIMEYCIGAEVYWRMFWILPLPAAVAYALALQMKKVLPAWKKAALAVSGALVIAVTGAAVYTPQNYSHAENIYKLPQQVVEICDSIRTDAEMRGVSEKKAVVANELLSYVRQYDGSIQMPYGRNALKNLKLQNKNSKKIFQLMCSQEVSFEKLRKYSRLEKCNYLVYYHDNLAREALCGLGYEVVGDIGEYTVFYLEAEAP